MIHKIWATKTSKWRFVLASSWNGSHWSRSRHYCASVLGSRQMTHRPNWCSWWRNDPLEEK